jgi:hypothetical protein
MEGVEFEETTTMNNPVIQGRVSATSFQQTPHHAPLSKKKQFLLIGIAVILFVLSIGIVLFFWLRPSGAEITLIEKYRSRNVK